MTCNNPNSEIEEIKRKGIAFINKENKKLSFIDAISSNGTKYRILNFCCAVFSPKYKQIGAEIANEIFHYSIVSKIDIAKHLLENEQAGYIISPMFFENFKLALEVHMQQLSDGVSLNSFKEKSWNRIYVYGTITIFNGRLNWFSRKVGFDESGSFHFFDTLNEKGYSSIKLDKYKFNP